MGLWIFPSCVDFPQGIGEIGICRIQVWYWCGISPVAAESMGVHHETCKSHQRDFRFVMVGTSLRMRNYTRIYDLTTPTEPVKGGAVQIGVISPP